MSVAELGFRALVTCSSHNADKSLQALKEPVSLVDIAGAQGGDVGRLGSGGGILGSGTLVTDCMVGL